MRGSWTLRAWRCGGWGVGEYEDVIARKSLARNFPGVPDAPMAGVVGHDPPRHDRASDAAFLATGRRRLTPEECAILQGFPPGYVFVGNKTQRYRQIGNACPSILAQAALSKE